MAIQFTAEERQLISKNRKENGDLPSFFNSQSGREERISRDFEAYLILQPQSTKQKVIDWIRKTLEIEIDLTDRDQLLSEYINNIKPEASARVGEIDQVTNNFSSFRDNLYLEGDRRFDGLAEFNSLTFTLQGTIEETATKRDISFQENNLMAILEENLSINRKDDSTIRELESWQIVFAAYNGVVES